MAYDADLVERVREKLRTTEGVTELRMFGGWGVSVHGNMAVGVMRDDLIVRVGADEYPAALQRRGARPFDFTGRPLTGWVYVEADTVRNGRTLGAWISRGVAFAQSLPPKAQSRKARRAPARRSG